MPRTPDDVARELRAAVLGSDHERATRLIDEYTEAVRQHWMLLSTSERAASSTPKQSIELLTWAREMTLMQQGMAALHLSDVEKASRQLMARSLYLQLATLDTH
jgi:ferric iron reductase protein FhuF